MNKKFLSAILFGALMVTSTGTFVSCKDYDEDIEGLQTQINANKDAIAKLQQLVGSGNWVTGVASSADGLVVTMSNGSSVTVSVAAGQDGKNGTEWTIGEDGYWYMDGEKTDNLAVAQGGNGAAAPSPSISANGNWVVYDFDAEKGEYVAVETEIPAAGESAYVVKANGVYELHIADANGEFQTVVLPATTDSFVAEAPAAVVYVKVQKAEWNPAKNDKVLAALAEKFPELAELKKGDNLTQGGELPLMVNPANVDLSEGFTFQLVDVKGKVADIELGNPVEGISDAWNIDEYENQMSRSVDAKAGLWTLDVTPAYDEKKYGGFASVQSASLIATNAKGTSSRTSFAYSVSTTTAGDVFIDGNGSVPYAASIDLLANYVVEGTECTAPIKFYNAYEGKYLIELANAVQVEKYGLSIAEDGHTLNIANMPTDMTNIDVTLKVSVVGLNGSTAVRENKNLNIAQTVAATGKLEAKTVELDGKDQAIKWAIADLGMTAVELDKVLAAGINAEISYEWTDANDNKFTETPSVSVVYYNAEGKTTHRTGEGKWSNGAATEFGFVVNATNDHDWIAPAEYTVKFVAQESNTVIYSAETTLTTSLPEITDSYIRLASAFVEEGVLQVTGEVSGGKVQYDLEDAFILKNVNILSIEDAEFDENEEDETVAGHYEWVNNSDLFVNTWKYEPEGDYAEGAWIAARDNQLYTTRSMVAYIYFFGNPLNVATYDFDLVVKSTIYSEDGASVITIDNTKLSSYFGATGDDVATAEIKKAVYAAGPNRGTEYNVYRTVSTGTQEDKSTTRNDYDAPKTNGNYLTNAAGQLIEVAYSDLLAMGMDPAVFTGVKQGETKFYLQTADQTEGIYGWTTIMTKMNSYYVWTDTADKTAVWEYNATIKALKNKTAATLTATEKATLEDVAKWEALFNLYKNSVAFTQVADAYKQDKTETTYHADIVKVWVEAEDADEADKYATLSGMTITPKAKSELTVDVKDVTIKYNMFIEDIYGMIMKVPFEVEIVTEVPAE